MELPSDLVATCLSEFEKNPLSPDSMREINQISKITKKLSELMAMPPPKSEREGDDRLCSIANLTDHLDLLVNIARNYGKREHPAVKAYLDYFSSLPPYLR